MLGSLHEIDDSDLPGLRDLYLTDWPSNISGYSVLETCVRWLRSSNVARNRHTATWFRFYSLNGDWSDGTFVCVHRGTWIFVDTLAENADRLTTSMQLIDWNNGFRVAYFMDRNLSAYLAVEQRFKLIAEREDCFLMFHMSKRQARRLDVRCPAGLVLRPIRRCHAMQINDAWPNRHEGSLVWFEHVIECNPSIGLFTATGPNELIGWTLKYENGPIGSINVTDAYKRRGLGTVLLHAMCRICADLGLDAFAFVRPRNLPSRRLFEKSGFRKMPEPVWWVHTWPEEVSKTTSGSKL